MFTYYQAVCTAHLLPNFQEGEIGLTNNGYENKNMHLKICSHTYRMRRQHYSLQRYSECLNTVKQSSKEMVLDVYSSTECFE